MMNTTQIVHVGMINSYNMITGKATLEEILLSGIGYLAHPPDELDADYLKTMISYFEELEMYDYCMELMLVLNENYHPDGTPRELDCLCDYPVIEQYSRKVRCSTCKKILRK